VKSKSRLFSTIAVHGGEEPKFPVGAVAQPIYQTSTFVFKSTAKVKRFQEGDPSLYLYTRYGNPTIRAAEEKIAQLEGGEAGLVFTSGMAAISTTILTLCSTGDKILATRSLYGGTHHLFMSILPRLGIQVNYIDSETLEPFAKLVDRSTKVFYIETPTNPNLKIVDIKKVVALAKKHNLTTVIDNTFATPYNQKPIKMGIDVAIESGTKYLAGHSDLIVGTVVGKKSFIKKASYFRKILGGSCDPMGAYFLLRGMKTLALRVEKQNQNGMAIAKFLEKHPKIKRVYYPGLPSHPQHKLAASQMQGFGGMITLEVGGGLKGATKVIDSFKLILNASSLGGVQSLASLPVLTSHYGFSKEDLKKADVSTGMVRLSCGIEDTPDLISDLKQALNKLK